MPGGTKPLLIILTTSQTRFMIAKKSRNEEATPRKKGFGFNRPDMASKIEAKEGITTYSQMKLEVGRELDIHPEIRLVNSWVISVTF